MLNYTIQCASLPETCAATHRQRSGFGAFTLSGFY